MKSNKGRVKPAGVQRRAGAVKVSEEEYKVMEEEKKREGIRVLFDYFTAWKTCQLSEQSLADMQYTINQYEIDAKLPETQDKKTPLEHNGIFQSKEALQLRYEYSYILYKKSLAETEYKRQNLIKFYGYTNEQIQQEFDKLVLGKKDENRKD
jgi:hypothetical protein